MGIAAERIALADTLEAVGPDGPTLLPGWTTADVAAHLVALDDARGVPTFLGRSLVGRWAVRLNAPTARFPGVARAVSWRARRRSFDHNVAALREPAPALLLRPSVAAVGLFEVFVHHEDVRRPNGVERHSPPPDLSPVVPWLLRYQRPLVRSISLHLVADDGDEWTAGVGPAAEVRGAVAELVLWLAGRREAADVALEGDADALAILEARNPRV